MKLTTSILLLFLCANFAIAQDDESAYKQRLNKSHCGTGDLFYDDEKEIAYDNRINPEKNAGYTQWPMRIHIVRKSDGTGGISLEDVTRGIANLNFMYNDIGLEYYLSSVNYIDDDFYYDFVDENTNEIDLLDAHFVNDALNVYFFNSIEIPGFGFACGYALYPGNSIYNARIFMANGCTATVANGTFAHELGHHLNLPHTFNGTSQGNSSSNAEHVPRTGSNSNCSTKGDYQCDTDADPQAPGGDISNCSYTGTETDIHGNTYTPPIDNVMSYYSDGCGGILTPGQYNRCSNAITTRLGHTAYDIDGAGPMSVSNPSGLTVTVNGLNSITLNWTDNANNEHGYLIERSSDGGVNFSGMELAGVGPNVTTYTDASDFMSNTTYCYRVKAVNDNANHYSNDACGTTPNFVCSTETDLVFSGGGLVNSPFAISGVPTSIPACQSTVTLTVTVKGDFDNTWEVANILDEFGATIGTTGMATALCDNIGGITTINIPAVDYNIYANDGVLDFEIGADIDVGDICSSSIVKACVDICIVPPVCPSDYAGGNALTGTQSADEDFETDGDIESSQLIDSNAKVDYDSKTSVTLLEGFEITIGALLNVIIDGCGGMFADDNDAEEEKSEKK